MAVARLLYHRSLARAIIASLTQVGPAVVLTVAHRLPSSAVSSLDTIARGCTGTGTGRDIGRSRDIHSGAERQQLTIAHRQQEHSSRQLYEDAPSRRLCCTSCSRLSSRRLRRQGDQVASLDEQARVLAQAQKNAPSSVGGANGISIGVMVLLCGVGLFTFGETAPPFAVCVPLRSWLSPSRRPCGLPGWGCSANDTIKANFPCPADGATASLHFRCRRGAKAPPCPLRTTLQGTTG